jgi:hypothetical protein
MSASQCPGCNVTCEPTLPTREQIVRTFRCCHALLVDGVEYLADILLELARNCPRCIDADLVQLDAYFARVAALFEAGASEADVMLILRARPGAAQSDGST